MEDYEERRQQIIDLIQSVESEDTLNEIKDILSSYFAQEAEKDIDKLWDSGQINETIIEEWKNEHM